MSKRKRTQFEQDVLDNLELFNKFAEEVLPQAGKLGLSIGVINDALIGKSKLIRQIEEETDAE
ncbi:hypothetical protein LCGC14_1835860 [marine sediment metagenome]|uniref:Uncharacterized protein n=1 Tax=marine sediment metagenome TaxID=412755 RepID=A0A0F9GER0_9ZZZZ